MTGLYRAKTRVHIEFDAEYAGIDDDGYQTIRCYDSTSVYTVRVPRNATITAVDHACNDPAGTLRREQFGDVYVVYRKGENPGRWQTWECVDSNRDVVGRWFTDEFVDEFPRVQDPT